MLILIKVRTKEKSSLNCEHQVLPWEKKVCRVGDLILLYWYNYIDLKVIKSSDIPVISGVVYDLGFCPKHVWIMWGRWGYPLTAGRVATIPPWAPPASHSVHLQHIQVAFGHTNRTGSTLGAEHKVSLGLLLPVGCTILVGYPVRPSCPERCTRGMTPKVLPAMNISMDSHKAPNNFVTTQALPGLGWAIQTHRVQPEHCYHAQPQDQVVAHHLPWGQGLAEDAQQETP